MGLREGWWAGVVEGAVMLYASYRKGRRGSLKS